MTTLPKNPLVQERRCLRCQKLFASQCIGNRLCTHCKDTISDMTSGMPVTEIHE